MILWSPLEQYTELISRSCPLCDDKSDLAPVGWTDGRSLGNNPRLIHGVSTNILLISRMYLCSQGHKVYGHHPSILDKFKRQDLCCLIPFLLWHKTGCTVTLCSYIECVVSKGLTMQQIEKTLLENRINRFYSMKLRYEKLSMFRKKEDHKFPNVDEPQVSFFKQCPTRHAITAFFLLKFWEKEPAYTCRMSSITSQSKYVWLSCDHTIANVGTVRIDDKRWITQYKGLFCVLNEVGQVLTWKFD